jgi:cytochrome c-type biogenesis protein CcmE
LESGWEGGVAKNAKFGIASGIILLTIFYLAWVGVSESKTYYHTIAELESLSGPAARNRIRVGGDIVNGSIERLRGRVDFEIVQDGQRLRVSYVGRDPLPDTFVDGAQALVEGKKMPDGRFVAEKVQAKCASKYEAVPKDGAAPGAPPQSKPSAAPLKQS